MIYLNNAATSYPKPPSVITAMTEALETVPESSQRSSYLSSSDTLPCLRRQLGRLFHISAEDRIFFTSGATDAINRIFGGLDTIDVMVSSDSHNSVLRPAYNLPNIQSQSVIDSRQLNTISLWPEKYERTTLLALPHCSNVTGHIHDLRHICRQAHDRGWLVMVDAAQSAGCIPVDTDGWDIDILVFTGHKSLFGPQGTGGFYVRPGFHLRPTVFGGTGRDSSIVRYEPDDWEYEVGTQNLPGLAGLKAGVAYILHQGVENIFRQEQEQTLWLIEQLKSIPRVKLFSEGGESQGPVVSFNIDGLKPADAGYILQNTYGITLRSGLHCAPLIHQDMGTAPWGTLRASLSYHTTPDELQAFVSAVREICGSL